MRQAYNSSTDGVGSGVREGTADYRSPSAPTTPYPKPSRRKGTIVSHVSSRAPKHPAASVTDWYIGTRPLGPDQPLRVRPSLRERSVKKTDEILGIRSTAQLHDVVQEDGGEHIQREWKGVLVIESSPPPPTLLAPPPPDPPLRKIKLDDEEPPVQSKKPKTKRVSEGGSKLPTDTPSVIDLVSDGTPMKVESMDGVDKVRPSKRGGRHGGRGGERARGRGRGRGGRKSLPDAQS